MQRPIDAIRFRVASVASSILAALWLVAPVVAYAQERFEVVDASALRGRVMCGYQGWFRCPEDGSDQGWMHWSRNASRLTPDTLTFEMWPDMSEYSPEERFAAPGFSHPDGSQAYLFSSLNRSTVRRHFRWMRDAGIDGAWLQHFLVELPGGPAHQRGPSRRRVLESVAEAAEKNGRVWALTYDIAGMPSEKILEVLTSDWKRLVNDKLIAHPRYLRQDGKPVVQIFGFYRAEKAYAMTPRLAEQLIEFFKTPGPYAAYVVGGGDWQWRGNPEPAWQRVHARLDAYIPWNIGNCSTDADGVQHATTAHWGDERRQCQRNGTLWIPTVYPGFGWDNLKQKAPGSTQVPRRGGQFLWEQFHELARLEVDTVYIAMFDEVDEGTAIFKVTSSPPTQATFVGYEGLPSDWYLRLTGEGIHMLRKQRPLSAEIPIKP